jgi:hypothetical protein
MKNKNKLEHPDGDEVKKVDIKLEPDMKCAPSKKYTNGSCFTLDSLKKIADSYNQRNDNKIDLNLSKDKLVDELETKLSDKCSDQICWLRLDVVKQLDDEDIEENTFRPKGPSKKYEWLSTTHINEVVEQYQKIHTDFLFLGAVPYDFDDLPILGISDLKFDELEKQGKSKIGIVFNLDEHYKEGSHWVALFTDLDKNQVYFFDSLGRKPMKRIRKFINRIAKHLYNKKYHQKLPINDIIDKIKNIKSMPENKMKSLIKSNKYLKNLLGGEFDIRFNHIQHQFENSECGVYSINFIIRLVGGELFDSVINDITKDEKMNSNRKIYFRNIN